MKAAGRVKNSASASWEKIPRRLVRTCILNVEMPQDVRSELAIRTKRYAMRSVAGDHSRTCEHTGCQLLKPFTGVIDIIIGGGDKCVRKSFQRRY
jgi:hypothetical protein